jgi:hypothetical protein
MHLECFGNLVDREQQRALLVGVVHAGFYARNHLIGGAIALPGSGRTGPLPALFGDIRVPRCSRPKRGKSPVTAFTRQQRGACFAGRIVVREDSA